MTLEHHCTANCQLTRNTVLLPNANPNVTTDISVNRRKYRSTSHRAWIKTTVGKWQIRKEGNVLFNDALNTFYLRLYGITHMVKDHSDSERGNPLPSHRLLFPISSKEREREMFYLTTHSTHFIYGYMASDIWLRTILIVRKETRCLHIGYSYRLTARVLLYAPSHRQDNTYHGLCLPVVEHWLERELN